MSTSANVNITYKKLSPVESLAHLENELNRYKKQKEALENTVYPIDQQHSKQLLLNFYTENINRIESSISTQKKACIKTENSTKILNKNRQYSYARSKYLGHKCNRNKTGA